MDFYFFCVRRKTETGYPGTRLLLLILEGPGDDAGLDDFLGFQRSVVPRTRLDRCQGINDFLALDRMAKSAVFIV